MIDEHTLSTKFKILVVDVYNFIISYFLHRDYSNIVAYYDINEKKITYMSNIVYNNISHMLFITCNILFLLLFYYSRCYMFILLSVPITRISDNTLSIALVEARDHCRVVLDPLGDTTLTRDLDYSKLVWFVLGFI